MISKCYTQSMSRGSKGPGRCAVKRNLLVIAFFSVAALSCEADEISFIVEHVKALPEAPSCSYSVSDDSIGHVTVDLALQPGVENAFLVKNQLMAREDYDNLVAESNGILTEGYEVSVNLASTNANIGGSNRFIQEYYIAPQTEELLLAYTLPPNVSAALADEYNCPYFNLENYPEDNLTPSGASDTDGNSVPRSLGSAYSTIRFFGHTQGQIDVETQDFSFQLNLCCGCSINWGNCVEVCDRHCTSPDDSKLCIDGVLDGSNEIDCRSVYYNPFATWNDDCVEDDDETQRLCTCDDC